MNYDNIIDRTKEVETILTDIGATGKGLHEKVSSIENDLNKSVVKAIRYIATIRNNALHDSNFKLTKDTVDEFEDAYEMVLLMLNRELKRPKSSHQEEVEEIELSSFEKDIIRKSEEGYVDPNDTIPKADYLQGEGSGFKYCPNCEEDINEKKRKITIENNNYIVKYCYTCDYVFSSKKI